MTYDEAVQFIKSTNIQGKLRTTDRSRDLLDLLGNPQNTIPAIQVLGTNGKTSVVTMLANILQAAGYKVGTYTPPYVNKMNEVIKVNGKPISDEDFATGCDRIQAILDQAIEEPTALDKLTTLGYCYFADQAVDVMIIEPWLGGINDPTNVMGNTIVQVITDIAKDHLRILGSTLNEITLDVTKALKPFIYTVLANQEQEVINLVASECVFNKSRLVVTDLSALELVEANLTEQTLSYKTFANLTLPGLGICQLKNAAVVLDTVNVLRELKFVITDDQVKEGFSKSLIPGRFQVIAKNPAVVLDVAHNPASIKILMQTLINYFPDEKFNIIFDWNKPKLVREAVDEFKDFVQTIKYVSPATDDETCYQILQGIFPDIQKYNSLEECWENRDSSHETTVIFGTFDLVADALNYFNITIN